MLRPSADSSCSPPLMCNSRSLEGQEYIKTSLLESCADERGRCRLSSFESVLVERRRSDIAMDSETKERFRRPRLEHFERAARQLTL